TQTYKVYVDLLQAYHNGDPSTFNDILKRHLAKVRAEEPTASMMSKVGVEVFFNEFGPYYHCLVLYAFLAVVCCLAWLVPSWTRPIQNGCFAAMAVGFVVHVSAMIIRMYLSDRYFVFVTNLYSSAVFIGLGCVLFGMIAEAFYRNGIAIVVGCVGGFATLII